MSRGDSGRQAVASLPAAASVVIPAYNEGAVLRRCLRALEPSLRPDADLPVEVVVVPNGCTDDTVRIAGQTARDHGRVHVVELREGSKTAALNAGDGSVSAYPRIYLDADIELTPGALSALVDGLDTPQARVASPRIRFDTRHADPLVRSYYRVFARLPYVRDGLIGLGVYGVSAAGRARFERFPDVVADDLMIQRLFEPHERLIVDADFVVRVPSDIATLVRVRTRIARGNAQLARTDDERFASSAQGTRRALSELIRQRQASVGDAACYVAVTLAARVLAARAFRRRGRRSRWERDESTRTPAGEPPEAREPSVTARPRMRGNPG